MFPIFYKDASRRGKQPRRPHLLNLPGQDYDWYPEIPNGDELEGFRDMAGMFQIPFPLGFPYLDAAVMDLSGVASGEVVFPLSLMDEMFLLEAIFITIPKSGAAAYPDTLGAGGESPMPSIQVGGTDPNNRNGRFATGGVNWFWKGIPSAHVGGPGSNGTLGVRFPFRRNMFFSARDNIVVSAVKAAGTTDPNWIEIGICGRSVRAGFLQGVIQ
jgi:hypothetical protein